MDKNIPDCNPDWNEVFSNETTEKPDSNEIKRRLKEEFSKSYERIRKTYQSLYFFPNNELFTDDFINYIPQKLNKINVLARPIKEQFHSCIITDEEVDLLASIEHYKWLNSMFADGWENGDTLDAEAKTMPDLTNFSELDNNRKKFYRELIYTIPVIFKHCGFELFKPAEQSFLKNDIVENLARAIHEKYRMTINELNEKSSTSNIFEKTQVINIFNRQYASSQYEKLPSEIKSSNLDSAYHIITKLLSIGYTVSKDKKDSISILFPDSNEIETMAKLEHERWAWEKRLNDFVYGNERNDNEKIHPCLIPYNELPESEKEKDRQQVRLYPLLLNDLDYSVEILSPEQLKGISYIPKQRILLQENIKNLEKTISEIKDKPGNQSTEHFMNVLNTTSENIAATVGDQYAASMVQNCIMPSKLFFRSCFPESFILFKPRDILSGDFYFVSKVGNQTVLAAADCTGHGIQGAMLSMLCSNLLDQAVNENSITDPSTIIDFVYKRMTSFMKRHGSGITTEYGMEISICTFVENSKTVFYSGINRPLWVFKDHQLEQWEPNKLRPGETYESLRENLKPSAQLNLKTGDTLYMSSDGYEDQIGFEGKKFKVKNMKILLESVQNKNMLEQYEILNRNIEQWKGPDINSTVDQTDDILVIGVKV
jgi:serine phosphatase RsbU (regulator of sigma subunit)